MKPLDYKHKYIKLFEAFKSSVLNNYKNLVNSNKFIEDFKRHFQHVNLHKITDEDFEYVPVNEFLDNLDKYLKYDNSSYYYIFSTNSYITCRKAINETNLNDADFVLIFNIEHIKTKYKFDSDTRRNMKPFVDFSGNIKRDNEVIDNNIKRKHKEKILDIYKKWIYTNYDTSEEALNKANNILKQLNRYNILSFIRSNKNAVRLEYFDSKFRHSYGSPGQAEFFYIDKTEANYNWLDFIKWNKEDIKSELIQQRSDVSYDNMLTVFERFYKIGDMFLEKLKPLEIKTVYDMGRLNEKFQKLYNILPLAGGIVYSGVRVSKDKKYNITNLILITKILSNNNSNILNVFETKIKEA